MKVTPCMLCVMVLTVLCSVLCDRRVDGARPSSSTAGHPPIAARKGGTGSGAGGRSLAAVAMMQDGEEEVAEEEEQQRQRLQQHSRAEGLGQQGNGGAAHGENGASARQLQGPGVTAGQERELASEQGEAGGAAGKKGVDLLSDALASVNSRKDKAPNKTAGSKPQIRVMAKPKAAPVQEEAAGGGGGALGLLGSYGSSTSSSSGEEDS